MNFRIRLQAVHLLLFAIASAIAPGPSLGAEIEPVDATTLRGRIMCGYQGWFRCPGDASGLGWVHWSHDSKRITPHTLTFDMWPDLTEFPQTERFAAPGFVDSAGKQAYLFSSDNAATVLRHFQWMRDYGIDGAWLQHFVVDLPGGPMENRFPSRQRVLGYVAEASRKTGRVWAISYDISGTPTNQIFDILTRNWSKLVDDRVVTDSRYLHELNRPVVQIWGFYRSSNGKAMTPDLGYRLIDFFHAPSRNAAYVVGGGDWDWRRNPDPAWQALYRRLDAYAPWNVANYSTDSNGVKHAATAYWADDQRELEHGGRMWIPVVYPGFSWDNLKEKPPGATGIPRRRGQFLWEQFRDVAPLRPQSVFVAMFDEVDEGTAIFKVTNNPPTQAHFVGYEGMPADWYLRLVGEGSRMLRGTIPFSKEIPITP